MLSRVLPRIGYAAVGAVWITIGGVAARVGILGARDRVAGMQGALHVLFRQPEGIWILVLIGSGLGVFAIWRAMQALSGRGSVLLRAAQAVTAIGYGVLTWTAARILFRLRGGGGLSQRGFSWLIEYPAGRAALQITGGILVIAGLVAVVQGATGRLPRWLVATGLTSSTRRLAARAARVGLAARGIVMLVTGYFLERAVADANPKEMHEVGGSLAVLATSPLGPFAMGLVAVGLIAYGLSLWVLAVSRRPA